MAGALRLELRTRGFGAAVGKKKPPKLRRVKALTAN